MSEDDDQLADALWQAVLADPEREQAHAALLDHCQRDGKLAEAARRYRRLQEELDEHDEAGRAAIDQRLAAITTLALGELQRQRGPEQPGRRVNLAVLLAAVAVLMMALYGLVYAFV